MPDTLHKSGFCTHIIKDVNFEVGEKHPKKTEYLKGFDYHCGHSYWAYSEVVAAIFGAEGEQINAKVMNDLRRPTAMKGLTSWLPTSTPTSM